MSEYEPILETLFGQRLEGNVEIPGQVAKELLQLVDLIKRKSPGVFDKLGFHPIQPSYWVVNLAKALEDANDGNTE